LPTDGGKKISLTSSKIYGGTITNWKQLAKSISRGKIFEKKFGKFISENSVIFPPYNKLKQSAIQLFEADEKQRSIYGGEGDLSSVRPDCILIIGGGSTDILRNAFYLEIPTIVSVDSHTPVNFCTYPVWGNTESVGFILSIIEWFFRCRRPLLPNCTLPRQFV
jgi:ribosomal protein S2